MVYLHDVAGIIHQKLSPSNIFYDLVSGTVKLGDFNSSIIASQSIEAPLPTCKDFSAPELLAKTSDEKDRRRGWFNDIYSFGKTLKYLIDKMPEDQDAGLFKFMTNSMVGTH